MKKPTNGDLRTWMLGAALAVMLAMGGYLYSGVQEENSRTTTTLSEIQRDLRIQGERVSALQAQQPDQQRRLERLEAKLDTLLQSR